MAWDTACESESPVKVILVPQGFSFVIQSTIFTGPCKGGLVLKVMYFAICKILVLLTSSSIFMHSHYKIYTVNLQEIRYDFKVIFIETDKLTIYDF